jgi:hypothetical protein
VGERGGVSELVGSWRREWGLCGVGLAVGFSAVVGAGCRGCCWWCVVARGCRWVCERLVGCVLVGLGRVVVWVCPDV